MGTRSFGSPYWVTPGTVSVTLAHDLAGEAARGGGLDGEPITGCELRGRGAEPDDRGHVLQSTATLAFLRAADDQRRDPQPPTDEERAGALGPTELVGGDAEEVGAEGGEVDRHGAPRRRRRRRGRTRRAPGPPRRQPPTGCTRAHLVVRELYRDERGVVGDRGRDLVCVEAADPVDADQRELTRFAPARVEHTRVLDRRRDHPAAETGPAHGAPDRVVDRLGPARGEHDLTRASSEELGDLLARVLDRDPGDPALRVQARGVAVVLPEEGEHRLERSRTQGRRRRVVEIGAWRHERISD